MSNLIGYNQRIRLWNSIKREMIMYYKVNFGKFTFMEFLNHREYLRKKYTALHATEKNKDRIPKYIWERFYATSETLMFLVDEHIEGGYLVFGKIYGHPGKKSEIPINWQDHLCPDDPSFRQKLLQDNYVQVWKKTGILYSDGHYENNPKKEYPAMTFYTESYGNFRFGITLENGNNVTGSEPFNGQTNKYKKVWEIMQTYNVPMYNVEEL